MKLLDEMISAHLPEPVMGEWLSKRAERLSDDPEHAGREAALLMTFWKVLGDLLQLPVPQKNGKNGLKVGMFATTEGNSCSGEIMWRSFHDATWPCGECGCEQSLHRKYEDGWRYCIGRDETCNCGNNIGR
ncbi:MAG: hypothetical protein JO112_20200 [Planctomycetes bacterium]|nr:hypothetical protein [Planctomycetota bacterium]